MEKQEVIYDHYKETCEICRNCEKERNKLFTIVCVLLTILFLLIIAESNAMWMLHAWIKEKYDYDLTLSVDTIQSLIWMLLLYFTIRYYQQCISIERLYHYVHDIENRISIELNFDITREGKNYLQKYPWVSNFIWIIYTVIFPALYLVLIVTKIGVELYTRIWEWNLCINIILGICDFALTLLYVIFLHKDRIKKLFHSRSR